MKKIIVIVIMVVIIWIIVFLLSRKSREDNKIKDIISFRLSYSNGYMANSSIIYEYYYDKEMNKYMVSVKPHLVADEDKVIVEAPSDFSDKIKNILIKYEVSKWNGFNKSNQNVLDGDDFSLSVRMQDNQNISAHGYMSWPKNYREVISEYDSLFMEIYNQKTSN